MNLKYQSYYNVMITGKLIEWYLFIHYFLLQTARALAKPTPFLDRIL